MKLLFLTFDYLTRPLGVSTLSAVLIKSGHQVEVSALGDMVRQQELLDTFQPDFLCLSLITGQHPLFIERARQIKISHPKIIVLAGGPHPTFYPECINEPCIDAICRGEGDVALPAFVDFVTRHKSLPKLLANWWIKQPDGTVAKNDVAEFCRDLDQLPFPDRSVFDRATPGSQPVTAYVMASRGCPFNCSYCFNHAYRELYHGYGGVCRRRSVDNVISEISEIRRSYPLQIVVFQDDTFNLDNKWLQSFCIRYQQEVGLPFHCHLRADLLDESSAGLLRQAGCLSVKLGLEAGPEHVRNGILKRTMSLEQFEEACRLLHKHGIRFATENILAIPGTSLDDDLLTYEINRKVRPHHSFATLMQIYPGTGIAEYALAEGFVSGQVTDFPATFYDDSIVAICNKEMRGRLRALFALSVSLNLPVGVVRQLIRLPLRKWFDFVDRFWKGYCLRFRIYPYRQSLLSFVQDVRTYLGERHY